MDSNRGRDLIGLSTSLWTRIIGRLGGGWGWISDGVLARAGGWLFAGGWVAVAGVAGVGAAAPREFDQAGVRLAP